MNILIIAPHPDDEILGCGGTIAKYISQGHNIFLCIMTKGEEKYYGTEMLQEKRAEVLRVKDYLGLQKVFFLDYTAANLDTYPQNNINNKLREVVNEVQPEIIFIPHIGDLHRDHQLTAQCVLAAIKLNSTIKKIFSYEALSETEHAYNIPFIPTIYIDISDFVEQKLKSLALYQSELREYPHPRSLLGAEIKAKARGIEVGVKAAETFMLIKEIS